MTAKLCAFWSCSFTAASPLLTGAAVIAFASTGCGTSGTSLGLDNRKPAD